MNDLKLNSVVNNSVVGNAPFGKSDAPGGYLAGLNVGILGAAACGCVSMVIRVAQRFFKNPPAISGTVNNLPTVTSQPAVEDKKNVEVENRLKVFEACLQRILTEVKGFLDKAATSGTLKLFLENIKNEQLLKTLETEIESFPTLKEGLESLNKSVDCLQGSLNEAKKRESFLRNVQGQVNRLVADQAHFSKSWLGDLLETCSRKKEALSFVSNTTGHTLAVSGAKFAALSGAFVTLWALKIFISGALSILSTLTKLTCVDVKRSCETTLLLMGKIFCDLGNALMGILGVISAASQVALQALPIAIIIRTALGLIHDLYKLVISQSFIARLQDAKNLSDSAAALLIFKELGIESLTSLSPEDIEKKIGDFESRVGPEASCFVKRFIDHATEVALKEGANTVEELSRKMVEKGIGKGIVNEIVTDILESSKEYRNKAIFSAVINVVFCIGAICIELMSLGLSDVAFHLGFLIGSLLVLVFLTPEVQDMIIELFGRMKTLISGLVSRVSSGEPSLDKPLLSKELDLPSNCRNLLNGLPQNSA